jgi:hypothetical protein
MDIVCAHVALLVQASVAVQVRVIVYACGHPPAAVTSAKVTTGTPPQLSVAEALPVFAGNVLAVHWIVTFAGQTMEGAVTSETVTTLLHIVVQPPLPITSVSV